VTYNSPRVWQLNLAAIRPWLTPILLVFLASTLGLGWLLKSILLLFGLTLLVPILVIAGAVWWSSRNVVNASCPVCSSTLTGFNGTSLDCPSCGEALRVEGGQILRLAPPNTIDIAAVEIDTP
jgi:Zn finger protein HypA/HybF involved in hydrogenase expression